MPQMASRAHRIQGIGHGRTVTLGASANKGARKEDDASVRRTDAYVVIPAIHVVFSVSGVRKCKRYRCLERDARDSEKIVARLLPHKECIASARRTDANV